jgi:hypothetical protein
MKMKMKSNFKAVAYMRQVREDLSKLIQTDPERFHDELKQTMADFIAKRQQASRQAGTERSRTDD